MPRPLESYPPKAELPESRVSEEDRRELEAARVEGRVPMTSVVRAGLAAMEEHADVFEQLAK